ncbi:MAG TPA: hypothetical protein VFL12_10755 [Thermoanaerobaculia bacterium]|nr:hypothetical protein [Thermoanaerobaculia bacterium]
MINSRSALTATTLMGLFGIGWLVTPDFMEKYWRMAPGENLDYMGHRYGALLVGLGVTVWLGRKSPDNAARRAVMIGALVSLTLTTALSLFGALSLGLHAWPAFGVELVLTLGLAWAVLARRGAAPSPAGDSHPMPSREEP